MQLLPTPSRLHPSNPKKQLINFNANLNATSRNPYIYRVVLVPEYAENRSVAYSIRQMSSDAALSAKLILKRNLTQVIVSLGLQPVL
eukprot:4687802-Amphidinium_carterae.1